MPSSPLGSTNGRTTSSVACHHHLWTSSHSRTASGVACYHRPSIENAVERRWELHAIIAFGQHTRSNDVGCGITSPPLHNTHNRTTSGVARHNRLWEAHTVRRRQAWHAIIALGRQTRSNDFRHCMPAPPLDSTHGRMKSGVACHHRLWATHTVERCQAWYAIIAFGQQKLSNDVGRGMTLLPLESHTVERHWAWHDITALRLHA